MLTPKLRERSAQFKLTTLDAQKNIVGGEEEREFQYANVPVVNPSFLSFFREILKQPQPAH